MKAKYNNLEMVIHVVDCASHDPNSRKFDRRALMKPISIAADTAWKLAFWEASAINWGVLALFAVFILMADPGITL